MHRHRPCKRADDLYSGNLVPRDRINDLGSGRANNMRVLRQELLGRVASIFVTIWYQQPTEVFE
jgi:hypothetical protein